MIAIGLCLTDPALRVAGLVIVLQGAIVCSFGPYFSALALNAYGFGDRGFAVRLALSTLVSITASVDGGHLRTTQKYPAQVPRMADAD